MKIGEIAQKTNLSESTLRYYEKKKLLKVERDTNGRRNYKDGDVEWIKFIRRLKETGMPIKDIRCYAELRYAGLSTMLERMKILQLHREYILEQLSKWTEYLKNLDDKIEFYNQSIKKQSNLIKD